MKYFPAIARTAFEGPSLTKTTAAEGHSNMTFASMAAPEAAFALPSYRDPISSRSHILIVDDDAGIRFVLERVLCAAGYRVSSADDGEAGWGALCADSFDLLITDHDMPRLSGLDLLRRLRDVRFELPVILMSGRMPWEEADLLEVLKPGMAVEKPFSFNVLLANVRGLLSRTVDAEPAFARETLNERSRDQFRSPVAVGRS